MDARTAYREKRSRSDRNDGSVFVYGRMVSARLLLLGVYAPMDVSLMQG